ncbi:MAG: hypothetical protein JXB36_05410, partial [Gammaproteobacteria bacterium]|nr:hypothetical protein [Gammaproteobacteria bacterium]
WSRGKYRIAGMGGVPPRPATAAPRPGIGTAVRPFFEHDRLTSEAPYFALTVADATHANFTDASAFVPLFDWLGVTGPVEGMRVIDIMNRATRRFFDAYLRNDGTARPDFGDLADVSADSDETP